VGLHADAPLDGLRAAGVVPAPEHGRGARGASVRAPLALRPAYWQPLVRLLTEGVLRQDEKKKYLKEAIEKLERALELNQDSRTNEGELAVFSLGKCALL